MMKSHLILRLHRIILIAALFLAASCKEDDTSVQLKAPQTLTAIPSETSLLIEWGGVDEAAAYELEARSDDYAFSTRVEDTRYELTGLEAYTEYEVRIRALVVSGNYLDSEWSAWERFKTLDKTIADEFDGGSGTEEDPYLIARPSQLALLAQCVNEQTAGYFEPDVHYLLTADLDLSGYENWTPIGTGPQDGRYPYENPEKAFQGVFDGGGHTVNKLNVAYTGATTFTSVGLFGVNDGTIRNLHVAGTVSATTSCTDKSYVIAGGIVGFNIIAYEDAMNTRPGSGAIEHCSFTGSVSASCGNDPTGTADAGGICGMAESGNIDFCETTLDAAHTIRTEGGEISMTGGIAGSMNGGRISACTFTGTGVLEAAFNTVPEGYYVYAQAGGIVGSTAEASIESCTADFGGSLLVPKGGEATCNAGIVCGNSGSSITDCTAKFTGDASIESNGAISFGGAVGSLSGVGECAVSLVSTEMGGTVKIAQGDEYSDVHVGGVFGSASNATASACDALLSGDIEISSNVADGTTNVNVGGVCGKSGMLTAGCHAEWTESAHVKIASDRSNFGGVTGLTQAESNYAFLVGCYALCKGRVEIEPKNGTDYTANAGGIAGTFSGYSMIYPVVMEIPAYMDGCYALVETDFSLSGGTARGVAGASEAALLNGVFWGSTQDGVSETLPDSKAFASLDQSGFEAAITEMNDAIAASMMAQLVQVGYTYDTSLGHPVLTGAR